MKEKVTAQINAGKGSWKIKKEKSIDTYIYIYTAILELNA